MSSATDTSMTALKRMGRSMLGHKRLVHTYPWQIADGIELYSDTDWSGCPRIRKSTSGGCVLIGRHVIKTWSSTQPSVTLSSGGAEFYGLVKAAGAGFDFPSQPSQSPEKRKDTSNNLEGWPGVWYPTMCF